MRFWARERLVFLGCMENGGGCVWGKALVILAVGSWVWRVVQGEPAGAQCSLNSWNCCVGQSVSGLDNYTSTSTKARSEIGKL